MTDQMYGIFINSSRPTSKKQVRDVIAVDPHCIINLEATSVFGNEYDGSLREAPDGVYTFVGPDPYTSRKFYGTITKRDGKVTVK